MPSIYFGGSRDVKELLSRALAPSDHAGLKVLDFPAGSGHTSSQLANRGAQVHAWDIFPEFFKAEGLKCTLADLQSRFPAEDDTFDLAIFQEGIEHLPDQLLALKQFQRILKPGGRLIVTTPNYSNLRSRYAYLCFESETPKMMPPNEVESVWYGSDDRVYYGHIFSIGIMRLRLLAKLAGLKLVKIHPSKLNLSSVLVGLFAMPFLMFRAWRIYSRTLRKNKPMDAAKRETFRELMWLNFHPSILLGGHLIVEFSKEAGAMIGAKPKYDHISET